MVHLKKHLKVPKTSQKGEGEEEVAEERREANLDQLYDLDDDEEELEGEGRQPQPPEEGGDPPQARNGGDDGDADDVGGSQWQMTVAVVVATVLMAVAAVGTVKHHFQLSDLRKELAAKADAAAVAQEIARLDSLVSTRASRSDLEAARKSIDVLIGLSDTLRNRVVTAEKGIKKNATAAAAAGRSAKEAKKLADEARGELARLDQKSGEQWVSTTRSLDSLRADLPREVDSRVGPLAVELATFRTEQGAVNAGQDSAIALFKLNLGERKLRRLADELKKREGKEVKKRH